MLPLRGVLRLRPAADTWRRQAVSAVLAIGAPAVVLLAVGHLELAFYTGAGAMCALYAHGMPYAARARALAWLALGMVTGTGVALATAGLTDSAVVRVAVIGLLAGVFKVVCDATRIGPPGNVILTFIAATAAFLPTRPAELPWQLALVLLGGVLAWSVCLAPGLFRPHEPERRAVARALESTARALRVAGDDPAAGRARFEAAAAVQSAWQTLRLVRARTAAAAAELTGLSHLVVRAESLIAAERSEEAAVLDEWARALRAGRPVPSVDRVAAEEAEIRGLAAERAADRREGGWHRVARAFAPSSPLFPIGLRVMIGSAVAGWTSLALGVDRPYWAVVTAAAVYVANTALSWQRAVQRVLGNLGGVLLFTALVPIMGSPVVLVVIALACQVVVEATVARNYALATLFITPMALVMTEYAMRHPARELVTDRWLDTCVGAAVGMLVCFAVPNRRVSGRVDAALRDLETVTGGAEAVTGGAETGSGGIGFGSGGAEFGSGDSETGSGSSGFGSGRTEFGTTGSPGPGDRAARRERLATALVELRESADTAAGEWWSPALPQERIVAAERTGHRMLAELSARPTVAS